MVVSNGAVQTINDTFVANVISKAVFSVKSRMNRLSCLLKHPKFIFPIVGKQFSGRNKPNAHISYQETKQEYFLRRKTVPNQYFRWNKGQPPNTYRKDGNKMISIIFHCVHTLPTSRTNIRTFFFNTMKPTINNVQGGFTKTRRKIY